MDEKKSNISIKSNIEGLELYSDQYPFRLSLRRKNFENETEYTKFIRSCERVVRMSLEYKEWRDYIIDVLGVNTCMITEERMSECTIEVHHHIPSMFVLVQALVNEKIENDTEFSTFDIALEAIRLHFMNKVGYVTLLKSMHEKFHNGYLRIPCELVRGDYQHFLQTYSRYIDEVDLETINQRLSISETNCNWVRNSYSSKECEDVSNY